MTPQFGTSPYTLITGMMVLRILYKLRAGPRPIYTVTVTDANGCTDTRTFEIIEEIIIHTEESENLLEGKVVSESHAGYCHACAYF